MSKIGILNYYEGKIVNLGCVKAAVIWEWEMV